MANWHAHARRLTRFLVDHGLQDEAWIDIFASTPRHEFAPRGYTIEYDGSIVDASLWTREELLHHSYADQVMVTRFSPSQADEQLAIATSSASQPRIVATMLQLLDVHDGQNVLEIGTGPGYNACLLSFRLGEANVTSIDMDPDIVAEAQENLARAGVHPRLIIGDGAEGAVQAAPFDRIIATCALTRIPPQWLSQLSSDAIVVAPLVFGSAMIVLHRQPSGELSGGLSSEAASFMAMRPTGPATYRAQVPNSTGKTSNTSIDRHAMMDGDFLLWLEFAVSELKISTALKRMRLDMADGCAIIEPSTAPEMQVTEYGDPIWHIVEDAYRNWKLHDRPERSRWGMTVDSDQQWLWLDRPDSSITRAL